MDDDGNAASEFFWLNPETGVIMVKKSLKEASDTAIKVCSKYVCKNFVWFKIVNIYFISMHYTS